MPFIANHLPSLDFQNLVFNFLHTQTWFCAALTTVVLALASSFCTRIFLTSKPYNMATTCKRTIEEDWKNPGRSTTDDKFVDMLRSPSFFNAFHQFLKSEFSHENLLFYRDVEKFREASESIDADVAQRPACENMRICLASIYIMTTYVNQNSPMQINISADTSSSLRYWANRMMRRLDGEKRPIRRIRIMQSFDFVKASMFDEAQKEVLDLMKSDCLPRFQSSKFYSQVKKEEFQVRML